MFRDLTIIIGLVFVGFMMGVLFHVKNPECAIQRLTSSYESRRYDAPIPTYSIRNPEPERPPRLGGQKWSNFTAIGKEGSFMPLFIQVAIEVLKMRGTLSVSCSLEASAMLGRVGYTIVCGRFLIGVFY